MRVLVVYDSVSPAKVTAKVAEAVVAGLKEAGASVDSFFVEDAKPDPTGYDRLIVGAPTMAWRPSTRMKEYLASLTGKSFTGKTAAVFDTQFKSAFSGNANKHMEKGLSELGFKIIAPGLISYVESENKQYKLKEGEMEKAKAWGREIASK